MKLIINLISVAIVMFIVGFFVAFLTVTDTQTERFIEICKNQSLEYKSNDYFQCFDTKTNSFIGPTYKKSQ